MLRASEINIYVPIPPELKNIDFFHFVDILEKIQNRVVKRLRIRVCVRPGEHRGRRQSESNLQQS